MAKKLDFAADIETFVLVTVHDMKNLAVMAYLYKTYNNKNLNNKVKETNN